MTGVYQSKRYDNCVRPTNVQIAATTRNGTQLTLNVRFTRAIRLLERVNTGCLASHVTSSRRREYLGVNHVGLCQSFCTGRLKPEQDPHAAETFGARDSFLSAGKNLLDTSHHPFHDVTAIRGQIQSYFRNVSLPYPQTRCAATR
jgi:hypothetical protein